MPRNKPLASDPAFEIVFYENILKHSPNFIEALVALAELYTKQGAHAKGLVIDQRLAQLRPDEPVIQYNLACSLSLVGDVTGAFDAIKRAIRNGYEDLSHLEKDEDLSNLMQDPEFQDYYRGIKSAEPSV